MRQRLGQADPLHHSLGVGADSCVGPGGHADGVEQFAVRRRRVRRSTPQRAREEFERLAAGEIAREAVVLGQISNLRQGGLVADGVAEDCAGGGRGSDDGHHDFDQCAFAGAVGTEKAEDLATTHGEGNVGKGMNAPTVGLAGVI